MCIRVEWSSEAQTAIRIIYEEGWNWRDHALALDVVNTLMDTVAHPVDLLLDLEHCVSLPEGPAWPAPQPARLHPNWSGRLIVISPEKELARAILEATPALVDSRTAEPV